MKKILWSIFTVLAIVSSIDAQGTWSTLRTGAGGWITGMDINPDGTKFIRSDVGGAYRLLNGSDTWEQMVTQESMPDSDVHWSKYGGVLSIASAASNVDRAYMAYYNTIYLSDDMGGQWQRTNFPNMEMRPNDDASKLFGERLEVDPNNQNKVFFGSIEDGLYLTTNGMDWSKVIDVPDGSEGRGVRSIVLDPSSAIVGGETQTVYVAVDGEGIYQSLDGGDSFTDITEGVFNNGDLWIYDMEIDNEGRLYISGRDANTPIGMYRYEGQNWSQVFTTDLDIPYSEIAINPNDINNVLLFSEGYSETYMTNDATSQNPTWTFKGFQRSADNIPWMAWTETEWFTLGEIEFDPMVADRIWVTLGTGTFYIDLDGESTLIWNEFSKGQEHLVSNDIVTFSNGNKLTAHWDFPIFLHTSPNDYPTEHLPNNRFNSCWDLSQSATDENFVVALIEDIRYCCWDDQTRNSSYSEDGGQTWTKFPSMPGEEFDLNFGQIEVSTGDNNNIVWLPGQNMNPFYTVDKGTTWNEVDLPGDSDNCCLDGPWFRRKALAADRVLQGQFYIYDWGSGDVFRSSDGGANWIRNEAVLPAWSFHGKLIAVPTQEEHLFFSNGPEESEELIEGLLRSTDGGMTWTEVPNTTKVINVTVGKAIDDQSYPTVYICGEVDGEYGYYKSIDNCESWEALGAYPMGIYDWPVAFEANPNEYGNVVVGFGGNGFVQYQESQVSVPTISERIHIDQFGYQPSMTKVAVLSDPQIGFNASEDYTPGSTFRIIELQSGSVVFEGTPTIWNSGSTHSQSGDKGWQFDFSSLSNSGEYYVLDVDNNLRSYTFEISESIYNEVLMSATKMFYYNRCNMSKEEPYAEANWTDSNNFQNDLQDANARYIYDQNNASLERDMTGGWFDAGDYNKYVTFAHGAVHNLLSAYDENSSLFSDDWNLPESNNGIPDLLDEINWELEWLEKMMNEDGGVHIKIGSKNYSENISSPPSANTDQRYYGPTCSAGSVAVASMFSHAAHTYQSIASLTDYGEVLEAKAITAFDYYLQKLNENDLDIACDDGSIVAGDADWDQARQMQVALIAAVYLYDLTGSSLYGDYIVDHVNDAEAVSSGWLGPYTNQTMEALFFYTTLSVADPTTSATIIDAVTPHVSQDWDGFYGQGDLDLYRGFIPDFSYHWGSNQVKADYANLNSMVARYNINPSNNESYLQKAEEMIHYYHGVNPLSKVYLSNMESRGAENSVDELYHAWFADGSDFDNVKTSLYGPAPGFIPGGANSSYSYEGNTPPYGQPAQKSYKDFNTGFPEASWEITEPAIYYQAAYIRMLASYANVSIVLPVDLVSFEAEKNNEDVELTWVTSSSIGLDRFEIESSLDGSTFTQIGVVDGVTNSATEQTYNYLDQDVNVTYDNPVFIYYRLKIIDMDGNFTYSDVEVIGVTSVDDIFALDAEVYPNPSCDFITVKLLDNMVHSSSLKIYNSLGKCVAKYAINGNENRLDISQLVNGLYTLEIISLNKRSQKQFIKM